MVPTPDTGELRSDLVTGISTIAEALTAPVLGHVLIPSISSPDLGAHPELREEFFSRVFGVSETR